MHAAAPEDEIVPRPGEVVDGKFRVERVIGAGGMGIVVEATHLTLETKVALKFLAAGAGRDRARLERLAREARVVARMETEHVARVLDLGGLDGAAARPYIVIEHLEGTDLARWLASNGRMQVGRAVDLVLEACEAVAEAHGRGIVHRDVKPANLFLARRADGTEVVKVLDFGIAKRLAPDGASLTETSDVLGSPRYMSPEQLRRAGDVTGRCDVWALGVVLFELVTGRPPFDGPTAADLAVAILTGDIPSAREIVPEVPAALDAAIARCLKRDPAERMPGVAALARAIAPFGTERARASLSAVLRWATAGAPAEGETVAGARERSVDGRGDGSAAPSGPSRSADETLSKSSLGTSTGAAPGTRGAGSARVVRPFAWIVVGAAAAGAFVVLRGASVARDPAAAPLAASAFSAASATGAAAPSRAPAAASSADRVNGADGVNGADAGPAPPRAERAAASASRQARPPALPLRRGPEKTAGPASAAPGDCPDPICARK